MKSFGARTKLMAVLLTLFTTLGGSLEASNLGTQSPTGRVVKATVGALGAVPAGTTAVKSKAVLASNVTPLSSAFALRAAAIPGRINLAPSSLSFGNVVLGQTQTKSATLSNSGKTPVTLTRASVSGRGFAISGIRLPLVLQAGQSVSVRVTFAPVAGGAASGSISVAGRTFLRGPRQPITFGRGGREPITTVGIKHHIDYHQCPAFRYGDARRATGCVAQPALLWDRVKVGATQTQVATVINSGGSDLVLSRVNGDRQGFQDQRSHFPDDPVTGPAQKLRGDLYARKLRELRPAPSRSAATPAHRS